MGSEAGSLGYRLSGDNDKAKAFIGEIRQTKFYKSLHECDTALTLGDDAANIDKNDTTDIWIDRWTHQITKLTMDGEKDGTTINLIMKPKFNQTPDIKMPEKWMTSQQLIQEVTSLTQSLFMVPSNTMRNQDVQTDSNLFS